jgi:hypothetical protein
VDPLLLLLALGIARRTGRRRLLLRFDLRDGRPDRLLARRQTEVSEDRVRRTEEAREKAFQLRE